MLQEQYVMANIDWAYAFAAISYSIKFDALPGQTCVGMAIVAEIGNSRAEVLSVSYRPILCPTFPQWDAKKITLIRHATFNPAKSQEVNS